MSLLLALASLAIASKVVGEIASDVKKVPARSKIQEDSKNGTFDVVERFEEILYINGVKRKSHGNSSVKVLPYTGYSQCLDYIRNHHLSTRADEQRFINHYKKVLESELSNRQSDYDNHYFELESRVKSMMDNCEYEIVRFEHIDVFVDYEDVEKKVNDICNTTFLGDFVVGEVKIKLNSSGNSFTEVWALKIPVTIKFSLKQYYKACAERCGYIY
ncbi:hypothetical protein [Methanobrevibacter sp.]|uniref:hypothetical protein n=1 Tax=Methanobrevibacter sp. TaxID=66852 RepID=UPI003866C3E9